MFSIFSLKIYMEKIYKVKIDKYCKYIMPIRKKNSLNSHIKVISKLLF